MFTKLRYSFGWTSAGRRQEQKILLSYLLTITIARTANPKARPSLLMVKVSYMFMLATTGTMDSVDWTR